MNSSNSIKVIAAFVTGILLALGGSLLFVRMTSRNSQAVVQRAASVPQPPAVASPAEQPAPATLPDTSLGSPPTLAPQPEAGGKRNRTGLNALGHRFAHNGVSPVKAQLPPEPDAASASSPRQQQIAQNVPPAAASSNPYAVQPAPPDAPAPRPAVQDPTSTPEALPPPPRTPKTVTLDSGMSIVIRLTQAISSDHNNSGDSFRGALQLPIIRDGFVIAEKGSPVVGRIVSSEQAGRVKGRASLSLALTQINTTDGQQIVLQTNSYDRQAASGVKGDAAKVGAGAAIGAIIGAIAGGGKGAGIGAGVGGAAGAGDVLLTKGKAVLLPSETELTFRLSEPVTITEKLN